MKKVVCVRSVIILFACALILYFYDNGFAADKPKFTKHFNESLFNITDKGTFSVEILLDDREYKIGKDVVGIVIHNRYDEDVEGAAIKILSLMPEGQISTDSPVVKDKGKGLYIVSSLNLTKEGKWELKMSIKKEKVEDSTSFLFPDVLKTRLTKGRYEPD